MAFSLNFVVKFHLPLSHARPLPSDCSFLQNLRTVDDLVRMSDAWMTLATVPEAVRNAIHESIDQALSCQFHMYRSIFEVLLAAPYPMTCQEVFHSLRVLDKSGTPQVLAQRLDEISFIVSSTVCSSTHRLVLFLTSCIQDSRIAGCRLYSISIAPLREWLCSPGPYCCAPNPMTSLRWHAWSMWWQFSQRWITSTVSLSLSLSMASCLRNVTEL